VHAYRNIFGRIKLTKKCKTIFVQPSEEARRARRGMEKNGESSTQAEVKVKTFAGLDLSSSLVRSLSSLRIVKPTPIQNSSIPLILSGCDLIGGSPTGSGKTLSFALPILQKLSLDMVGGYAVILTPTRELGLQLYEQFVAVGDGAKMGLKVSLVLGGLDMMKQATELSKSRPHIIVATPGRLVDIIKNSGGREWGLERCKFVVSSFSPLLLISC
jgi:ATP-dependent RNA helicase DDX49/DBP8